MILKVTQGHHNCGCLIDQVSLVCSNIVCIVQPFQDITIFSVYMTAYDPEKTFSVNKTHNTRISNSKCPSGSLIGIVQLDRPHTISY